MSFTVPALAAAGPDAPVTPTTIERREPGPRDVVIDVAYTGICHTDIALLRNHWMEGIFPMVPGHEITGTVRAVGPEATRYTVGDRVGVSCYVDSCRECVNCRAGEEQHCLKGEVLTCGALDYDKQMLDFCAQHGIAADVETVPADQVNGALDRLDRGDVRYRFVIDISTLGASD